jgi:hypothetical protein
MKIIQSIWTELKIQTVEVVLLIKNYKLIIRILLTSVLVLLIANFMTGVHVAGFTTALISCSWIT